MADELNIKVITRFTNDDDLTVRRSISSTSSAATRLINHATTVATSGGELSITLPANGAYIIIKNLDDTNFVNFGVATGVYPLRLPAGQLLVLYGINGTLYYLADTANCELEIIEVTP